MILITVMTQRNKRRFIILEVLSESEKLNKMEFNSMLLQDVARSLDDGMAVDELRYCSMDDGMVDSSMDDGMMDNPGDDGMGNSLADDAMRDSPVDDRMRCFGRRQNG